MSPHPPSPAVTLRILIKLITLITLITPDMSHAQAPITHKTPQSLTAAYFEALKSANFEAFQSLKWYRRGEAWIREQLTRDEELDGKRYIQLLQLGVSSVMSDRSSEKSFKASLEPLKYIEDWSSWTVRHQSDCDQGSEWQCSVELNMLIKREGERDIKLSMLIWMRLIGEGYHLDQSRVFMRVSHIKVKSESEIKDSPIAKGRGLYKRLGCVACHGVRQGERKVGPSLYKIYKSTLVSSRGERRVVDEAHLRESLLNPKAFVVSGYPNAMPSYKSRFKGDDLNALIEYLKTL